MRIGCELSDIVLHPLGGVDDLKKPVAQSPQQRKRNSKRTAANAAVLLS